MNQIKIKKGKKRKSKSNIQNIPEDRVKIQQQIQHRLPYQLRSILKMHSILLNEYIVDHYYLV